MGGWVKEERRKHGQQGFCLASLPWTQERGCPHKPGVRPRERERGCPAGLSTGDHASSTSRPPPVHVRCRWARKQLRGCLQTRAGHQRRGKGLLSASPVGAQWDKVKTPWGPRENPPAGATEGGVRQGKPPGSVPKQSSLYVSTNPCLILTCQRGKQTGGKGGSILEPNGDSQRALVPSDMHHILYDMMEATHSPPLTEAIFTCGGGRWPEADHFHQRMRSI